MEKRFDLIVTVAVHERNTAKYCTKETEITADEYVLRYGIDWGQITSGLALGSLDCCKWMKEPPDDPG